MKYITTMEAAALLGKTKRYVTAMCADGEFTDAHKSGYRWLISENEVLLKAKTGTKPLRHFNTTGACNPKDHYMVPLEDRIIKAKKLVDDGCYFTINRARQYGKTTTLQALAASLSESYIVVSMDFQMQMSNSKFRNENSFAVAFARAFITSFRANHNNRPETCNTALTAFEESLSRQQENWELVQLFQALSVLCGSLSRGVVLIIDEVDSAANNQVFMDFLAQLRGYYINRSRFSAFHSVILAGVCDVRNLRRKLRPDEEHKDNSPWNIAADFDVDMSFAPAQITQLLQAYEADHRTGMDCFQIAGEIYAYTGGYPYLVSRLGQLMDQQYMQHGSAEAWSRKGFLEALRLLVKETNSLFDDAAKKVRDYPLLKKLLNDILFCGRTIPFNTGTEVISIGSMFGFLREDAGQVAIANRIFEIWFYNLFIAEEAIQSDTYQAGQRSASCFVQNGKLDMEQVLRQFVKHFTQTFGSSTQRFVEENGRKLFLLYIRPLINGTGNYYIEARTRSMGRTDLIIDYQGTQYVIEMKIWHGEEYNTRGEEQLVGYLDDYHLRTGYLLSFSFNKNKQPGVHTIHLKQHTIIEAIV